MHFGEGAFLVAVKFGVRGFFFEGSFKGVFFTLTEIAIGGLVRVGALWITDLIA